MKPFQAQTFYELLEVSVSATSEEIRAAYERLDRLFGEGQNALYGLADAGHTAALRKRLREALDVLADEDLRAIYDEEIGLPPRQPGRALPPAPALPQPRPAEAAPPVEAAPPRPDAPRPEAKPQPPPLPARAPAPLLEPKPPSEGPEPQLAMGDLLARVDASVASTRPALAFMYERASPPPPDPKSAIVPLDPPPPPAPAEPPPAAPAAAEPVAPPPASAPPSARPATPSAPRAAHPSSPRPSGPRTYPSAPRPSGGAAAESSALATTRSAPRPSAPTRPLAAELPKLPEIPPDAEFSGELLRTVRTALGISVAQLAERTRIGGKHIENVEADRYAALPAAVYLRGILMSIARELGLDGIRVARSYLKLYEAGRTKG